MTDESSDRIDAISANLAVINERVAAACALAGRSPSDVTLVAVTKTHNIETIRCAMAAGLTAFGENYVQEAVAKFAAFSDDSVWHFIGNLQSNKAHFVVGKCALIQTIDRTRIAQTVGRLPSDQDLIQDVLIQVRLGTEATKSGCAVEDLPALVDCVNTQPGLRLRGLMGIAPLTESDGKISDPFRYFNQLKSLHDSLNGEYCDILSMGMSGDYEAAIAAGSTMVRVGSALFGARSANL